MSHLEALGVIMVDIRFKLTVNDVERIQNAIDIALSKEDTFVTCVERGLMLVIDEYIKENC